MKKHIALGIAAAVLGASGVAGAVVSVNQITALGSSESAVSVDHDQLAADCWTITGASSDAGCNTSVAGIPVPGLPEIPNLVDGVDLPDTAGLLATATGALDTATGALSTVTDLVPGGVPGVGDVQGIVGGAVPSACGLNVPVGLPNGVFSAGLNLFHMAQSLAMNDLGVAGVSSPVELPVALPVSADDIINKLETEVGCLAAQDGGLPIPAVCSIQGGLPADVTGLVPDVLPAEIGDLLSAAVGDLASLSGQGISVAEGGTVGVSCNVDGVLAQMPIPGIPALPAVPALPSPTALLPVVPSAPALPALPAAPLPAVPDVTGTVTGVVDTVTGVVNGLLGGSLPVDVPPLPLPVGTPECSASASAGISGLLGSLTSTITGGCN